MGDTHPRPVPEADLEAERNGYCTHCEVKAVEGASFCTSCGLSLTRQASSTTPVTTEDSAGRATGRVVKSAGSRKWIVLSIVLVILIAAGVAAAVGLKSSTTPTRAASSKEPVMTTTTINYAPAGSTHSFADGYNSETRLCKPGWPSCAAKVQSAGVTVASGWCTQLVQDPPLYGGPTPSDNHAQWLQGCNDALGLSASRSVSGPATPTTSVTVGSSAQPTTTGPPSTQTAPPSLAAPTNTAAPTTTAFSASEQMFLNSVQAQLPGITGDGGTAAPAELVSGGQSVCSVAAQTSPNEYAAWDTLVAQTTNGNLSIPDGPENAGPETFVAIAITDLCPAYSDLIPPGTPGAS